MYGHKHLYLESRLMPCHLSQTIELPLHPLIPTPWPYDLPSHRLLTMLAIPGISSLLLSGPEI